MDWREFEEKHKELGVSRVVYVFCQFLKRFMCILEQVISDKTSKIRASSRRHYDRFHTQCTEILGNVMLDM